MICPKCNSEIKDGSKFCTNCGEPLPKTKKCVQCGAFIKEEALFCTNCGTKQPVKEEKPKVEEVQPKNEVKTENPTPKKEETPVVIETPKTEEKKTVSEPKVKKEQVKVEADSVPTEKIPQEKTASTAKEESKKPKPRKRKKVNWIGILLCIGMMVVGYWKAQKSSNKEEYQQQYMEFENTSSNEQGNYMSLSDFYNDYVFGNKDFSSIAQTTCTPRLLQQLKDAYEYECESGDCYAMWLFRSGNQDGVSDVSKVTNVTDEGDGWFKVSYIDMGIEGATYIRLIQYGEVQLIDEIRRAN